jgi:hypothetical protein
MFQAHSVGSLSTLFIPSRIQNSSLAPALRAQLIFLDRQDNSLKSLPMSTFQSQPCDSRISVVVTEYSLTSPLTFPTYVPAGMNGLKMAGP